MVHWYLIFRDSQRFFSQPAMAILDGGWSSIRSKKGIDDLAIVGGMLVLDE